MSAAEVIKAKKKLTDDPSVKSVFTIVKNQDDGLAAMEIALMECALAALHLEKNGARAAGRAATDNKLKKFYRAVAKTRLATGLDVPDIVMKAEPPSREGKQWIESYERENGERVKAHWRSLRRGETQTSATKKKIREERDEYQQREESRQARDPKRQMEDLDFGEGMSFKGPGTSATQAGYKVFDGLAEAGYTSDQYQGAIRSYLSEKTLGSGVLAVADFFAEQKGKYQFAAKAISQFGFIAGARLAHSYFRYGGYDVQMQQKGDKVVTELGDSLPEPGSVGSTRSWAVKTLSKRLPDESADRGGAEPPSEGFIIDSKGNVLAHGVGRGNDHFLPFSVKHMRQMRQVEGVEYVRRRMFGGPTSEDLHAAMMMGADRVTVVSNGGTFTIELSKRSHGLKMEHTQILQRYQDILDDRKLTFSGYNSALDALQAEFPLHFRKDYAEGGKWASEEDRIGPKGRLRTQLQEMFDVLGGDDESSAREERVRGNYQQLADLPGWRTGDDAKKWYSRQIDNGVNPRAALNELGRFYQGKTKPDWLREREAKEYRRPGSGGATSSPERMRAAAIRPDDPNMLQVSEVKAAQRKAPDKHFNSTARRRLIAEQLLDESDFQSTEFTEEAHKMAAVIADMSEPAWKEAARDTDFIDSIYDKLLS